MSLDPRIQKQVDLGSSGTDIMHGELKNLMYEAEQQLILAQEQEDRKYWEGQLDALTEVYTLTYNLTFAIDERIKARG